MTVAALSVLDPHASSNASVHRTEKLPALTSLRFFAAAIIVLFHCQGFFGIPLALAPRFELQQGVSFFFILSGFILTYVYASLEVGGKPFPFWRARVARIWPAHVVTFLLLFLLLPLLSRSVANGQGPLVAITNLALLQSWIPLDRFTESFNAVTWTLSVEVAFYLLFPWLIRNFRRRWPVTMVCALIVTVLVGFVDNERLGLFFHVSPVFLSKTVPPVRFLEFLLGMATAMLWGFLHPRMHIGRAVGTCIEAGTLVGVVWVMGHSVQWSFVAAQRGWVNDGGAQYLRLAGITCIPFAAMIFVMAMGWGWITRLLGVPWLVLLGEISYTVYLVHVVLLRYYNAHPIILAGLPNPAMVAVFWVAMLLASYVIWALIESPCRRLLLRIGARSPSALIPSGDSVDGKGRIPLTTPTWRRGCVALLLLLIPVPYVIHMTAAPSFAGRTKADEGMRSSIDCVGLECTEGVMRPQTGPIIIALDQYAEGYVDVAGYAIDAASQRLMRSVYLVIDDRQTIGAAYGFARDGYTEMLGGTRYTWAWYIGKIPIVDLSTGDHTLRIRAIGWGAQTYFESPPVMLRVAGSSPTDPLTTAPGSPGGMMRPTGGASLVASPNPVPPGEGFGATTLRWSTADNRTVQLWVAVEGRPEALVTDGTNGSVTVRWIQSGVTYTFALYDGRAHVGPPLQTVVVSRASP